MSHDERINSVVEDLYRVLEMLDDAQEDIYKARVKFAHLQEIQLDLDRLQTRLDAHRKATQSDIRKAKANYSM